MDLWFLGLFVVVALLTWGLLRMCAALGGNRWVRYIWSQQS